MTIRTTKKQRGGFLGTLLASIAAPMLLGKLLGSGLQNRPPGMIPYVPPIALNKSGRGLQDRPPRMVPYILPVALGRGKKKKKSGKGLLLGRRSPFNSIPLLGAVLQALRKSQ